MTRQPKTPRTKRELFDAYLVRELFLMSQDLGYRRRKKGRRAKSGQWWRRYPSAVLWGSDVGRCVDATICASVRTNA